MAMIHGSAGAMTERLALQSKVPTPVSIVDLAEIGGVAFATTAVAHGFKTGDRVRVLGAEPPAGSPPLWGEDDGLNGLVTVAALTPTTFSYPVTVVLGSPSDITGTITALYVSDAQGGVRPFWTTYATVWAEMVPIRAAERLQAAAIQVVRDYRFRLYARADTTEECRALWTPTWPPGSTQQVLEITGALPDPDCSAFMLLECSR